MALLLVAFGFVGTALAKGKVAAALEQRLAEVVRERAGIPDAADIRITDIRPSDRKAFASAASLASVVLPPGERGTGKVTASVTVTDKKGKPHDLWVSARVEIVLRVVVAARDVARGTGIRPGDVVLEARTQVHGEAFSDVGQVVGREARRAIRKGEVLDGRLVTLPIAVRRGDVVDAVVTGAAFRVRTRAEARESGAVGDVIRVQLQSGQKRIVRGRVVSAEMVEVTE